MKFMTRILPQIELIVSRMLVVKNERCNYCFSEHWLRDLVFELKIQEIHFLAIFAPKLFAEIRSSIFNHLVLDCWSDRPFSKFRMMRGLGDQEGGLFGTWYSNQVISGLISFLHNFCSKIEILEQFRFSPESSKNLRTDALFQNCELLASLENNSGNRTPDRFTMPPLRSRHNIDAFGMK